MSDLIDGAEIQSNGLRYYDWNAHDRCAPPPFPECTSTPDWTQIFVVSEGPDAGSGIENPGLRWDSATEFATSNDNDLWIAFDFFVEVLPGSSLEIYGMQLTSDQGVFVNEAYGDIFSGAFIDPSDAAPGSGVAPLADLFVDPENPMDEEGFFTPHKTIWVDAMLYLHTGVDGSAFLQGGYQRFPLEPFGVPIAPPWLLMAFGLGAVGWTAGRRPR